MINPVTIIRLYQRNNIKTNRQSYIHGVVRERHFLMVKKLLQRKLILYMDSILPRCIIWATASVQAYH